MLQNPVATSPKLIRNYYVYTWQSAHLSPSTASRVSTTAAAAATDALHRSQHSHVGRGPVSSFSGPLHGPLASHALELAKPAPAAVWQRLDELANAHAAVPIRQHKLASHERFLQLGKLAEASVCITAHLLPNASAANVQLV